MKPYQIFSYHLHFSCYIYVTFHHRHHPDKQEKAEHEALMFDYYVTPDHISVAVGGFVTIEFNEWDKIHEKSSAGFPFYPIYSNGEIWVTRSYGENFMGPKKFGTNDEKSIGYTFER